jgi:hypothetical protein
MIALEFVTCADKGLARNQLASNSVAASGTKMVWLAADNFHAEVMVGQPTLVRLVVLMRPISVRLWVDACSTDQ